MAVAPGQLSVTAGLYMTGTLHSASVMLAGQVMVGFSASLTVTVNEQLPVLPAWSVAEQVTVVVPTGKVEPEAGKQVDGTTSSQLSDPVGAMYWMTALH